MKLKKYPARTLFFRQHLCTAETNDGRKVEVSMNMSGDSLIGMFYQDGKHVSTYLLPARSFAAEVLRCEEGSVDFEIEVLPEKDPDATQEIRHERVGRDRKKET